MQPKSKSKIQEYRNLTCKGKGLSDKEFEKLQKSLPMYIKKIIEKMIDNECRSEDWLNKGSLCGHQNDDHIACNLIRGHKGKHYCIDCGFAWSIDNRDD